MQPCYAADRVMLYQGDCRAVLAALPAQSVDAVLTDPPYELGFMAKKWDSTGIANDVAMWREVLRVTKPGGHLLAFGGTRTQHRMVCAIEDAGWEIRDTLVWMHGQGFPKSLDIGKALDKQRGDDVRPVCRYLAAALGERRITDVVKALGFAGNGDHGVSAWFRDNHVQPRVPTWKQWLQLKALLGFDDTMDAEVWRLNGRKGQPGEAWYAREVIGEKDAGLDHGSGTTVSFQGAKGRNANLLLDLTAPATDLARQWDGWGSALKPAIEPIVLARAPLSEPTLAANVAKHGAGGLNIDGCRIGYQGSGDRAQTEAGLSGMRHSVRGAAGKGSADGWDRPWKHNDLAKVQAQFTTHSAGRWPANVLLSHSLFCTDDGCDAGCPVALLDGQSGVSRSSNRTRISYSSNDQSASVYFGTPGKPMAIPGVNTYTDQGGASRFFYCAKPSAAERSRGLPDGERNDHPTVKPIALARYLARLITPPAGLVLDPFMGSGSLGCGVLAEGFRYLGIEQDPHYCATAAQRLRAALPLEVGA